MASAEHLQMLSVLKSTFGVHWRLEQPQKGLRPSQSMPTLAECHNVRHGVRFGLSHPTMLCAFPPSGLQFFAPRHPPSLPLRHRSLLANGSIASICRAPREGHKEFACGHPRPQLLREIHYANRICAHHACHCRGGPAPSLDGSPHVSGFDASGWSAIAPMRSAHGAVGSLDKAQKLRQNVAPSRATVAESGFADGKESEEFRKSSFRTPEIGDPQQHKAGVRELDNVLCSFQNFQSLLPMCAAGSRNYSSRTQGDASPMIEQKYAQVVEILQRNGLLQTFERAREPTPVKCLECPSSYLPTLLRPSGSTALAAHELLRRTKTKPIPVHRPKASVISCAECAYQRLSLPNIHFAGIQSVDEMREQLRRVQTQLDTLGKYVDSSTEVVLRSLSAIENRRCSDQNATAGV